jgi:hypothetical protein
MAIGTLARSAVPCARLPAGQAQGSGTGGWIDLIGRCVGTGAHPRARRAPSTQKDSHPRQESIEFGIGIPGVG